MFTSTVVLAASLIVGNADPVRSIADDYLAGYARMESYASRLYGIDTDPGQLIGENSPEAIAAWTGQQQELLARLDAIDPDALPTAHRRLYSDVRGKLEAALALRVCRPELWPINHLAGWHLNLPGTMAEALQDHAAPADASFLDSWAEQLVAFLDQEERNLRTGLEEGFSSPRSVVLQVAAQYDEFAQPDSSLLGINSSLSSDAAAHWNELFRSTLAPRFGEYAAFLRDDYAPQARESRSLSALPSGLAGYEAYVLHHTGARIDPAELAVQAQQLVDEALAKFTSLGASLYDTPDYASTLAAVRADYGQAIRSPERAREYAQSSVDRLLKLSRPYFHELPENSVTVELYPESEWGSGSEASYRPDFSQGYHGRYFLNPQTLSGVIPRAIESTASHETAPGHHIQAIVARHARDGADEPTHPILTLGMNNAFVEGWARYAERLAIEEGLLEHAGAALGFWQGYGMPLLIDVSLHSGALTEDEVIDKILALSGVDRSMVDPAALEPMLDRFAMMPAQGITYDLGGDFIYQLRERAKEALGEDFDIRTFHRLVLEEGSVTLARLAEKVEAWIQGES